MSVSDAVVGAEAALLDKIRSAMDRIDAKSGELQTTVSEKLSVLPGFLQETAIEGWNRFCGYLRELWDRIYGFLDQAGSPSALWDTADAWSAQVGSPVSGQVQSADACTLKTDDTWNGAAADAYRQTLPPQKLALDKIKSSLTDGVASALSDVARGIIVFWSGLAIALIALVAGLISALSSAATVFGAPAAPFIAAGAALAASVAIIAGSEVLKAVCSTANATLQQKLADNAAFPGGHWPPAVTT